MRYIEIAAEVPSAQVERTADVLRELTGRDVSIERPFTQRDLESDALVDATSSAIVRGYADGERASGTIEQVRGALASANIDARVSGRQVVEEDWAEAWKEYFQVERFGERIVVVPSWRTYAAAPRDVVVTLDPGMAFGTGQHETTRMCLEQLEQAMCPGARVLDVGCGSGILSIAAARLGAGEVAAVDVDAGCVRVTDENARLNGVVGVVRARRGSLGEAWPFDEAAARFDVILANVTARVIVDMASELAGALTSGGSLIVSGIIGEREREVVDVLTYAGLRVDGVRAMGDWRCIEATR